MTTTASAAQNARPYPQTPVVETLMAVLCLILNLFVPGLGTLVSGIVGGEKLIGRAVAQLLLTVIVVGWIWGVITGIQLIYNATWADKDPARRLPR